MAEPSNFRSRWLNHEMTFFTVWAGAFAAINVSAVLFFVCYAAYIRQCRDRARKTVWANNEPSTIEMEQPFFDRLRNIDKNTRRLATFNLLNSVLMYWSDSAIWWWSAPLPLSGQPGSPQQDSISKWWLVPFFIFAVLLTIPLHMTCNALANKQLDVFTALMTRVFKRENRPPMRQYMPMVRTIACVAALSWTIFGFALLYFYSPYHSSQTTTSIIMIVMGVYIALHSHGMWDNMATLFSGEGDSVKPYFAPLFALFMVENMSDNDAVDKKKELLNTVDAGGEKTETEIMV